ncbi:AIR synthase family protein [Halospeciosus flavus]|uniref:AIR synthase family protein n=1 Tax=Halospeciosus flavus TaxID=3032283 RepID=A0ABD5Z0T2_9EURY|nr:AIR synthase family protein [Halospeciosus flavus]
MGKFTAEELVEHVFDRTGVPNEDVLVGPATGEDAAAIDVGDETLVVSADSISLAADRIGQLGVAIASNDVAASGGVPEWLVATLLLPRHDTDLLDRIAGQIDETARALDQTVVGGHTESVAGLERPLVSLTSMGVADRFVPTGGADPGDRVVLTKGAGIEATGVLATDFRDEVNGVDDDVLDRAAGFFDELSVIPESKLLSPLASGMHDPTEGGVLAGLVEMALAADLTLDVERAAVPVRPETEQVCRAVGVDPLRVLGSGGLLATLPEAKADTALAALDDAGIEAAEIGRVRTGDACLELDGERLTSAPQDGMYALWE